MAYLVLAAGAVMVLIGALAIITGYPIIQIERGWSTVIAGTSLLAGGIVTMALALVLRALMDLRFALVAREEAPATFQPTAVTKPADRSMEPLFASRDEPASEAPHRDQAMLGAAAVAVSATALALHETPAIETHPAEETAPEYDAQAHEQQADGPYAHDRQIHEPHAAAVDTPADEHARDEADKPTAPGLEDWLDRAFADLHEPVLPVLPQPSARQPLAPEPSIAEHAAIDPAMTHPGSSEYPLIDHAPATQVHDDHLDHSQAYEPHRHEQTQHAYADVADPEPATAAPVASQPTSAVIGRYEADGTSYTMYADGSIDAQSDIGIYRFGSMAELKAFIEG